MATDYAYDAACKALRYKRGQITLAKAHLNQGIDLIECGRTDEGLRNVRRAYEELLREVSHDKDPTIS